jgi:diguanylate cyclase (GGDEF)-like protein
MVVIVAALTAGAVTLGDGGDAYWICLPAALLAASFGSSLWSAALRGAIVVAAAAAPALIGSRLHPLPSTALVILVPAAGLAVLLALRQRLERERDALRHSALSDPLTGIANRRSLLERIDYEIARHARARRSFALVMIDLDGFKALNDRFGHAAGDELLREAAGALSHTIRAQDTAARIGGDEFCVLAPETHRGGIVQLDARIHDALGRVTAGVEALQASTGTAIFPADGASADALLQAADHRLLATKRERYRDRDYRRAA